MEKRDPLNFMTKRSDSLFSGNCQDSSLFLMPVIFPILALLPVKGKTFPLQRYWIVCSCFSRTRLLSYFVFPHDVLP